MEQQIASVIRTQQAMEEDWLYLHRLLYTHFPPPPPPIRIELIGAIVVDDGETTAIVTAQPFGDHLMISDFC